jgi:hypothetical protein
MSLVSATDTIGRFIISDLKRIGVNDDYQSHAKANRRYP